MYLQETVASWRLAAANTIVAKMMIKIIIYHDGHHNHVHSDDENDTNNAAVWP